MRRQLSGESCSNPALTTESACTFASEWFGTDAVAFEQTELSTPHIDSIEPTFGPAGTVITIRGRHFEPWQTTVKMADGECAIVEIDSDKIRCAVPPASAGIFPVVLTTETHGGAVELPAFTYTAHVTSVGAALPFVAESCEASDKDACIAVVPDGSPTTCTDAGACTHIPAAAAVAESCTGTADEVAATCTGQATDTVTDCTANFGVGTTEAECTDGAGAGCTYTAAHVPLCADGFTAGDSSTCVSGCTYVAHSL